MVHMICRSITKIFRMGLGCLSAQSLRVLMQTREVWGHASTRNFAKLEFGKHSSTAPLLLDSKVWALY